MCKSFLTKTTALMLLVLLGCGSLHAQQAITFCGGDVATQAGSLSFSGGEVAVQTSIAPAITVVNITESFTEGVQQPFTERDRTRYEGIETLTVEISLYPNPTTKHVVLECSEPQRLTYTLFNTNGQTLKKGTYNGGQEQIDMQPYAAGNYMLQVANEDNTKMNVYKIIKAN
ncbi:MAG: T9SS type A sorting domain-containing protein [Bacteroidales bacterium]|jgi:hypothetical protein|nr:T9SS type A sorting domain-containing protein [Bacteroidales bacterium]MBR3985881.1 T9SS type A sorting domain-containing protein [Bacteroidales bacterium]